MTGTFPVAFVIFAGTKKSRATGKKKDMKQWCRKKKFIPVVLLAVLALYAIASSGKRDPDRSYHKFRAEGLTLREALPSAPAYIRKYFATSELAPDSIREMADRQKGIWQELISPFDSACTIEIAFTGDIMWIRNNWDNFADPRLIEKMAGHDMVFGNLETPVDTVRAVRSFLPDYARYNSAPGLLRSFRRDDGKSIFTAVSLANNHAFDMGLEGLGRTMDFLDREGILHTGAATQGITGHNFVVIEEKGIRIGFHAASWGLNDPDILANGSVSLNTIPGLAPPGSEPADISEVKKALHEMDSARVDIKIVFLHWGYEFEFYPDTLIVRIGREIADAGADLIIGSHPHVIQPVEIWPPAREENPYKGRRSLIAYSLGNFTTAMYTRECRKGMVLPVTLYRRLPGMKVEWVAREPFYVYNSVRGFAGRNRRLVLYKN